MQVVIVTLGEAGCLVVRRGRPDDPLPTENDPEPVSRDELICSARHYPPPIDLADVVSVNSAGDCFAAAFAAAALSGRSQDSAVSAGMQAARRSVGVAKAVPGDLDAADVDWERRAEGVDVPVL